MVRPSIRSTHIVRSSKRRDLAELFMPSLFDQFSMLVHGVQKLRQCLAVEADAVRDANLGMQPEFRLGGLPVSRLKDVPKPLADSSPT